MPRFIDWGGYRERMEQIAAEALGTEVEIVGDIAFTLLPQPRMTFSDVIIGPAETPVAMIGGVEAEFSLFDFLRDRYKVTKLVLEQPRLELRIDESGALQTGIWLAEQVSASNVSIENAEIVGGMVRLTDARTARSTTCRRSPASSSCPRCGGRSRSPATGSPTGRAIASGFRPRRVGTDGTAHLSAFVRPTSEAFSLTAEGTIEHRCRRRASRAT